MIGESTSSGQFSQVQVADGHDRYVPNGIIDLCAGGHLSFYEWVATEISLANKRVLDLWCGSGYGVARLAEIAKHVDGVDQSTVAIAHATKYYSRPNNSFAVADLTIGLPTCSSPGTYDVAVTSEVIEHVTDLFGFAHQLHAALGKTGVAVVGTPNRLWTYRYRPGGRLESPSHVMELTPAALTGLMRLFFGQVELYMHVFPVEFPSEPDSVEASGFLRRLIRASRRSAGLFARELLGPESYIKLRSYATLRRSTAVTPSVNYRLYEFPYVSVDQPGLDMARCLGMAVICRDPL